MTDHLNKPWRALKPNAQAFDEVRITTVPRWKESEFSGDEWRISAKVELLRNGNVIHEAGFRDVETACAHLAGLHSNAVGDAKGFFGGEGDFCDQEGCKEQATVTYRKLADYCRAGHRTEPHHVELRKFCDRHKRRGDCGLDDADANYVPFDEESNRDAT